MLHLQGAMKTAKTIAEVRAALAPHRKAGDPIGFVPTMGALHEGHLSLVREAKKRAKCVVVSIFVNPTQFAPNEDLAKYPRTLEKDSQMLETEGVDVLFVPSAEEMYGADSTTWVTVGELGERNEGRMRPGHTRGVATVVAKLFNIVQPDFAFFGQKDAAQLAVVRRMTRDLRFPIEIVGCPIIREADGLAMSSRNVYLSPEERKKGLVLYRALRAAESTFKSGETTTSAITAAAKKEFDREGVTPDYIELLDPETLEPLSEIKTSALLAVAAKIGATRLLDNVLLNR
jgi:pantoate--beta-alanine ligase